jgi:uncharacterized membrane protein HdeD (DUF308 family)
LEGVFLLFSRFYTFHILQYSLGITLIVAALVGFLKALSRQRNQVEFTYHEIHALTIFVYGLSVLLFANTLEVLTNFSVFLFIFYTFSEIIFCNWLFNLHRGVMQKIVFFRVFLALLVGIGTIILMYYDGVDKSRIMEGFGVIFIIIGVNILLYIPAMKPKELERFENNAPENP